MHVYSQYVWNVKRGISCPSHLILRSRAESFVFSTLGVGFGTLTVASALGLQTYKFE